KVINKLNGPMKTPNYSINMLGGPGKTIQIDETMLNFKCKSHKGRSPLNKINALCIIEIEEKITRAFAVVTGDKKESTIVPIICDQVAVNSIIWTDQHKSYSNLSKYNFTHRTICHKYNFVNEAGRNTQAVESFNNIIKQEIKSGKGMETSKRSIFLKEVCFKFNNTYNLSEAMFDLIII
ncbi:hypothetical protein H312_02844, partial [Anncaliia algerae PRA339]